MALIDDVVRVDIALTTEPWATTPTWTNVSTLSDAERPKRGVLGVDVSLGRDGGPTGRFRPRTARIVFNNNDADFDPENPGSVFGSNLKRNRLVRVRTSDNDFGSFQNLFVGYLDDVVPAGDSLTGEATLIASDLFRVLEEYDIEDMVRPAERSGARVAAILDEVGVPAGWRETVAAGAVMMPAATLASDALSLLHECARAEHALMYCSRNGQFVYRERWDIVNVTAWSVRQHSFTASGAGSASAIRFAPVVRSLGLRRVSRVNSSRDGGERTFSYDTTAANNPPATPGDGPFGLAQEYDADCEVSAEHWHKHLDYDDERIPSVEVLVYPGNDNAVTAVEAGYYDPLTRVEVQCTPAGFTTDFNYEARVEGADHRITPDEWSCTVTFSPYETEYEGNSVHWFESGDTLASSQRFAI